MPLPQSQHMACDEPSRVSQKLEISRDYMGRGVDDLGIGAHFYAIFYPSYILTFTFI